MEVKIKVRQIRKGMIFRCLQGTFIAQLDILKFPIGKEWRVSVICRVGTNQFKEGETYLLIYANATSTVYKIT